MKHCRELLKRLKEAYPGIEVVSARSRVHIVYELTLGGVTRSISVAVSPRDPEFCIRNAVKEAGRRFSHLELSDHADEKPTR